MLTWKYRKRMFEDLRSKKNDLQKEHCSNKIQNCGKEIQARVQNLQGVLTPAVKINRRR